MAKLINYHELKQLILAERDKIPQELPSAIYDFGISKRNHHGDSMRGGIRKALRCLEQCKPVDAVEVVRCKDCSKKIWCEDEQLYWCAECHYRCNDGEWYCAGTARKENGNEVAPLDIYSGNKNRRKAVIAICEDGRTFRFPSERDAARLMGVQSQNIVACLKGRLKTAGGYRWKYADDCCSYGERKDNG